MAQIRVTNLQTGQTGTMPEENFNASKYSKIGASPSSQPQMQQQSTNQVSGTPSTVGMIAGSLLGTAGGPLGRTLGATIGSGVGQEVAQAQAGQSGDLGAFLPALGPGFNMFRQGQKVSEFAKTGKVTQSPTEKAMATGAVSQMGGEVLSSLFSLLKPGVFKGWLNNQTNKYSKEAIKTIPYQQVLTRFYNESMPKVVQKFGAEDTGRAVDAIVKMAETPKATTYTSASELNFLRKLFGNLGKGKDYNAYKLLTTDLNRILKEEEVKLAPKVATTIGAQKGMENIGSFIKMLPFNIGKLAGAATNLGGSIVGGAGSFLSKYAVPPFLKTATQERNPQ